MVERKRRKKNKVRGERTHGMGGTKNRRGAGCRGGRGNAGANKHKFHSLKRLYPKKIRLNRKAVEKNAVKLGDLDRELEKMVSEGKAEKKGSMIVVDARSGYTKVLSQGKITKKIRLKIAASEKAAEKIVAAGGAVESGKEGTAMNSDEGDEDFEFESAEGEPQAEK